MVKIVSTFIFLLLGSSFLLDFDLLNSSKDSDKIFLSSEETEEISTVSDIQFSAGLQKNLQKIKIISGSEFIFFSSQGWTIKKILGLNQEIIPNLNIAKIIYPFHSFL